MDGPIRFVDWCFVFKIETCMPARIDVIERKPLDVNSQTAPPPLNRCHFFQTNRIQDDSVVRFDGVGDSRIEFILLHTTGIGRSNGWASGKLVGIYV